MSNSLYQAEQCAQQLERGLGQLSVQQQVLKLNLVLVLGKALQSLSFPTPSCSSMKVQYTEEKLIQLFPQCQDVLIVTPWLAPIIWEGTFKSEILDSACRPLHLTIWVTAFAIGKYTRFGGCFLESAEKHFMKGYRVNYYIFSDNPEKIPNVQLQPG
ncbi:hypothetical protein QYF61_016904 [Mycteria americana]|uniref:Uncharacterized protein n=1 Tax=Mycteria americana TaxID=33587 RepID=A0AAN7NAB1_MYCAM|nr:hypothetical protein QYF61_016904 [Mycteria americana]